MGGHELNRSRAGERAAPEAWRAELEKLPKPEALHVTSAPVTPEDVSGIYFLFQDNRLVYVGQAKIYFTRIAAHLRHHNGKFNRMAFMPVARSHIGTVEAWYIRTYAPALNKIIPSTIPAPAPPKGYQMSRRDAARLLQITVMELAHLHRAGKIARYFNGTNAVYDLRDLTRHIAETG